MSGERTVLLRFDGGTWHPPSTAGYGSEADLQAMLAGQPSLLPGVGEGARAVREFATRVGPSDVVVVGADGALTLVECKLASNEEARRKIVAQVFDYAARIWGMTLGEFESRWVQRGGRPFEEWLDVAAIETLQDALADGTFRLVLAVDTITADLKRLVEYLNAHMADTTEVLAVELNVARERDVEVLIPTVYGAELSGSARRPGAERRTAWKVGDVHGYLAEHLPAYASAVARLVEECERAGGSVSGTRAAHPSFIVGVETPAGPMYPFAFYTHPSRPALAVNFGYAQRAGADALEEFLRRTAAVLPELDAQAVRDSQFRKRPGVPGAVLLREGVVDALADALTGLVAAVGNGETHGSYALDA